MADQVVVITGAAGGIGRALAVAFAARGDRLGLLDLDTAPLAALAADLETDALAVPCDVTDSDACAAAIAAVAERFGRIDVLVNNAGISHVSAFADTAPEVVRAVMEVNFFGAVSCTRAALPWLVRSRGQVLAMSSIAGFSPLTGRTAYAASKHALHGFFDTLRTEVEDDGVGVMIVCPSFTRTGIRTNALDGRGRPRGEESQAAGRVAEPEEVAAAVVRAVDRRRRQIVLSPIGRASWWLSRCSPRTYAWVMRRATA